MNAGLPTRIVDRALAEWVRAFPPIPVDLRELAGLAEQIRSHVDRLPECGAIPRAQLLELSDDLIFYGELLQRRQQAEPIPG